MAYPELKRAVRAQAEAHKATVVLIEDRASGTQLIQELIAEGVHAITRYAPEGDKQMRLYAQTATVENGFVYLPREAPWLAEYLHELSTFPNSKYDDSGRLYFASARLDQASSAIVECLELQLARIGFGEASRGQRRRRDRRRIWSADGDGPKVDR
jgi:phage terminase large subunit-like protein